MVVLAGAVAVLAVGAIVSEPVAEAVTGRSVGALVAEAQGQVDFEGYISARQAPAGTVPSWLPEAATSVVVVRPGVHTGLAGSARVVADVPASTARPAACVASSVWSMPFDVPSDWPHFTRSDQWTCGDWTLAIRGGRWYTWSSSAAEI